TGSGRLVILLLGVLAVTAEFRHGTVTGTFLHSPRRIRVLTAKAAAIVVVAAAGAVSHALVNPDVVVYVAGLLLAYPLYGVIGVAAGALIVYQPVAVLLPLA